MNRSFDCKSEELPIVCRFCASSLSRDLADFTTFSPVFDAPYLASFKARIEAVQELVQPQSETIELKVLTQHIYHTLDDLISPINHLGGYLQLTGKEIPISSADFGLVSLRKSVRVRDVENVLKQLHIVGENIHKYKTALMVKGLTEALIAKFTEVAIPLTANKEKKYLMVSNRAVIVQNNRGLLNELGDQLAEICRIGKILYGQTDKAKLKDYTFAQIMKQIKRSIQTSNAYDEPPVKS
jgi:hypothetical protein